MDLKALLEHVDVIAVHGSVDRPISDITRDSREAGPRSMWVAVVGAKVDGHQFVAGTGAAAVVVDRPVQAVPGTTVVQVADTKLALAQLAAAIHGFPARSLPVVGITGTNGKTTIATLADASLTHLGWRTGRIGTTGNFVLGEPRPTRFTTPEAPAVQGLLAEMRDASVQAVLMEVTSIGLAQRRVDGIEFELGVFTNLTRDHLDFHGTLAIYREAKARLFRELLRLGRGHPPALLFGDDPAWSAMGAPPGSWRYGFSEGCDLRLTEVDLGPGGTRVRVTTPDGPRVLQSPLLGTHNALNVVATWGILRCLGVGAAEAGDAVGAVTGVPGRLERVVDPSGQRLVVVDYAHTEDALRNVLSALRPLTRGALWVVFGCGGDRDAGKRPRMAVVAEEGADRIVVTSDNPRSEDPEAIVAQIGSGLRGRVPAHREVDRATAIAWALSRAQAGDTVLIAGKGHETSQEIGDRRIQFDDREVARAAMEDP